jgi:hypothetical protein
MISRLLTHSRLTMFRRCQREHYFTYVLGFRAKKTATALRVGTAFHDGLKEWKLALPGGREEAALAWLKAQEIEDRFERVRLEVLLEGYDAMWAGQPYEFLLVEQTFTAPLAHPVTGRHHDVWTLAGQVDAIIRDEIGRVMLLEHKTTTHEIGPGSDYHRKLATDGQVSLYYIGAEALGHKVAGCVYDVARKPELKPLRATPPENRKYKKTGELYANQRAEDESAEEFKLRLLEEVVSDPGRYYRRADVVRLEQEMHDAMLDIWQLADQMARAEEAGHAPRNPDACQRYGGFCPFFDVCSGTASLEDESLFTQSDDVHPELSGLVQLNKPAARSKEETYGNPSAAAHH